MAKELNIEQLKAENEALKLEIDALKEATIEYKNEMEAKLAQAANTFAPEKAIVQHDGKSYELQAKTITLPEIGVCDIAKIKADATIIATIVENYPGLVKDIS